jgi:hypothetical protein
VDRANLIANINAAKLFSAKFSMIDKLMQLITRGYFIIFSHSDSFNLSLHSRALTV